MKKMNKKKILTFTILAGQFLVTPFYLSAQNAVNNQAQNEVTDDSNLELPEVTTEVEGATLIAGEDALPDFSFVIKMPSGSEDILPELPEVAVPEKKFSFNTQKDESDIYAEGRIGGGYPGLFIGDFSVYQKSETSPFKLDFDHNSSYGYGNQDLLSSYKDRDTSINLEKTVRIIPLNTELGKFKIDLNGNYQNVGNGLQSKSELFTEINQNNIQGNVTGSWNPVDVFTVGTSVAMGYYNRYADYNSQKSDAIGNWISKSSIFSLSPDLFMNWEDFGFSVGFKGSYSLDVDAGANYIGDKTNNRAEFDLSLGWKNEGTRVYGIAGLVFGNQMKDISIIFPFTVGLDLSFPTYFSTRNFSMGIKGGLDSKKTSIDDNELLHKFSGFSGIPTEQSDWYGKLEITVPIKTTFTTKINGEFRTTAFNNGLWDVSYIDSNFNYGVYSYSQVNRTQLKTDLELSYHYKIFSITGKWHSNWLYVPAGDYGQLVTIAFGFQNEDSIWGADASFSIPADLTGDYSPIIGLEAFVGVTSSVRIVLSVQDMYKLFSVTTRPYAGVYAGRSGNASLLVKFFF